MNTNFQEAEELIIGLMEGLEKVNVAYADVVVCPPFPFLELATDLLIETEIFAGAQNVSDHKNGAFTGEVSAEMLQSMDVDFCIVGHSERRKYFNEAGDMLAGKLQRLIENNITPIFCCGELLPEREANKHFGVVEEQLKEALFQLGEDEIIKTVIAYEPVWAIGTGLNATPEQAQGMHEFIRDLLKMKFGEDISDQATILYGGSCNSKNAKALFSNPDVDGGLIGGASLKADEFIKVILSMPA